MRTQAHQIPTRDAILEASIHLFGKNGYTGTTMRDIANAVAIQPGSLYAHIHSKEMLLAELVEAGINRFLAIGKLVDRANESAIVRLRIAIKAHIAITTDNPQGALIVFHQWRFLSDENLLQARRLRRNYQQIFDKIVADGVKSGEFNPTIDPRIAIFTILGALNWTPEWYSPKGPANAEEIGEKFADYLLHGLLKAPCSRSVAKGSTPVAINNSSR